MTSSTFILSGRSTWRFCHETWLLKDTALVTRSDIKPSLVSLNCASQDLAANLVPRIGGVGWGGEGGSGGGISHRSCSSCHKWLFFFFYRLAHRSDCLDKKLYPLLTHKHRFTTQKCSVCHVFIGRCVFVFPPESKRVNKSGLWILFSPDGSPPTTGWLRATPASSATSASECCTMINGETSWENSRPSHLWTVVLSTKTPLGTPV